jgi:hypothetical protein
MAKTDQENEIYSEEETVARREAALKRLLATPHKPHKKTAEPPKEPGGKRSAN